MDETLIVGYLQHTLNEDEMLQFRKWLDETPENRRLFKEFKKVWSLSQSADPLSEQEADKEFSRFRYRYFQSQRTHGKNILHSWYITPLKYAAVFAVAFLLAYYLFHFKGKVPVKAVAAFNEITTKAGERTQVTLADGSKIWVNACTSLKYPVNLTSGHVDLYLDGEAYFDLKKIAGRTITVHTSRLNINVLGTAFNLKSYGDDNIIETTLVRGKIAITHSSEKASPDKMVYLSPNQTAVYFKDNDSQEAPSLNEHRIQTSETREGLEELAASSQSNLIIEESVNPESQTSWIEGKFTFRKETFENLTKSMERRYNVKINILDENLKKARFSGTFDNESIEQALKALSYPVPFEFIIIKDSVVIRPQ